MKNKQAVILGGILFIAIINFFCIVWFYESRGYLPPPLFHDKSDTFMDFYNVLYWSGHDGVYTDWQSVYPPLNFLFLQIYQFLFLGQVDPIWDKLEVRGSGISNTIPILIIYIIALIISIRISFTQFIDLREKIVIFLIFLISPPFLFALERGNLIIICIPLLCWLIFSGNHIHRSMALAILVNLKPYFAIFYIIQLINRKSYDENKDFIFLAPVFGSIIFLLSGLILKQDFYVMPLNLLGFATKNALFSPIEVLSFSSSITSFSYLGGLTFNFGIPPIIGHASKFIVYLYLIKILIIFYKNNVNFNDIVIFSIIFITNYSISTGGYSLMYYLPIIALLFKERDWNLLTIIIAGMFIGVWDLIPIFDYNINDQKVFLSGEIVDVHSYMGLGSAMRPIANFAVLVLFFNKLRQKYHNE